MATDTTFLDSGQPSDLSPFIFGNLLGGLRGNPQPIGAGAGNPASLPTNPPGQGQPPPPPQGQQIPPELIAWLMANGGQGFNPMALLQGMPTAQTA